MSNEIKLTGKEIRKAFWIWQFYSHANYNYERMQGGAFAAAMTPVIDKLYPAEDPDKKEQRIAALQRHMVFFNTNPNVGTLIHGAVISMEEERANGADISDEAINAVKTGRMGPLAGIGDALDQGMIIPLIVAIGISIAKTGNVMGSLFTMIVNPLVLAGMAYFFWMRGYKLGNNAITSILSGGKMKTIINAASILGCTVMGALICSYVSLSTNIVFHIGQSEFNIQTMLFDAILPQLLPLLITLGVFKLLGSEKWNATKIMILLIAIGFIGGCIGIF